MSRLSDWLGTELTILEDLPDYSIVIIICLMTAVVTEVSTEQPAGRPWSYGVSL